MNRVAILTGDVVASSHLPREQRQRLPSLLKDAGKAVHRAFPKAVPYPVQVFRGDSWQLAVAAPPLALRAALFFRCHVIASSPAGSPWDTRVAIAIGAVDFLPPASVSEGDGPAYRFSGEALDAMKHARMAIVGEDLPSGLGVIVVLLDALAQKWTGRQALAVKHKLQGLTQTQIASAGPGRLSQQAIADQLARARWPAVAEALQFAEDKLKTL
jgi:hypothetical protein